MSDGPEPAPPRRAIRITAQALTAASECPRRLWLQHHGRRPDTPVPAHVQVLRERSAEHERSIAARFTDLAGPLWQRTGSFPEVAAETVRLLRETRRPIWQGPLLSPDGVYSAQPDFLWWDGDQLVMTEARLALRPGARADFALQMAHCCAVLEMATGITAARCEVVNGYGEVIVIDPSPPKRYDSARRLAEETLAGSTEPEMLLAHSNCKRCTFYEHCWDLAEASRRIELLPEVQAPHVPEYHARGVRTIADLVAFDPERMPAGALRGAARRAVVVASAWHENRPEWLKRPVLPDGPLVWFDLEGDSRGEDAEIPIYLWGIALELPGHAPVSEAIIAELHHGGDTAAWERFVERANEILDEHPGARWVHWDAYETLWIQRYAERHGAPEGFVERMRAACFDLKQVLDRSLRLPLRSYSIKYVAPWMGFHWRNPESGSEWSVAHFHRACETEDAAERERLLTELAEYNEDDLWAMRAIWRWMQANAPAEG